MKKKVSLIGALVMIIISITCLAYSKKWKTSVAEKDFNNLNPTTRKVLLEYLDGMIIDDASVFVFLKFLLIIVVLILLRLVTT